MRSYYAALAALPGFAYLSPSHQFDALVEAIAVDHPSKAAEMRGWNRAGQNATLGWLADVVAERPPTPETELWRLRKDTRERRCVAIYLPVGIDLRLMDGDDFTRTELLADAPAVRAKADDWRQQL